MTIAKPTVVFIHGLWHTPAHFEKVRKIFEDAGYPTSCDLQPSIETVPALGLQDDAKFIRDILSRLIEGEEKDVIVIGHSYGGVLTSEAAEKQFAKEERLKAQKKGGILHLLYICAFLLPVGKGIVDALGGYLPPGLLDLYDHDMCIMSNPAMRFYHDLSDADREGSIGEMRKSPVELNYAHQTKTNYVHHPVTYLYCEGDQGVLFSFQQAMVEDARKAGVKIATEHCSASHSPFLSMPERVLEVVQNLK